MNEIWYYMKKDRSKHGPVSEEQLISLMQDGSIESDEYIWMQDLSAWLKVCNSIYSFYLKDEPAEDEAADE